jgi:tetratricopeptide (TPR) repeat protein
MKLAAAFVAAALLSLSGPLIADVLTLKDGTRLDGDVKRTDAGYQIKLADGSVRQVRADQIASIEVGKAGAAGAGVPQAGSTGVAADRLASLRRSVEPLRDIGEIITRYQRFIEQNPGTPAADEAAADLRTWQDRRDRGLVKVAGNWVTPDEAQQMIGRVGQIVDQARAALLANDLAKADELAKQALEIDPTNASAFYLEGVLIYRQDKLPAAKKAFDQANASAPGQGATLNDLAVILWRQNQYIAALNFYDQAMQAMPANKEILNNVAEALNALNAGTIRGADALKKQPVVAKVGRRFQEQDARLQGMMAQYGWYRWGGSWVDQPQLDRLKDAEKQVHAKMDQMQKDFDAANTKIATNNQMMSAHEAAMQQMERDSIYRDANGNLFKTELPPVYYEYQRERDALIAENNQLKTQIDSLKSQAKKVEQQIPQPKYTGSQQLIGAEGMPPVSSAAGAIGAAGSSATQPAATQPVAH